MARRIYRARRVAQGLALLLAAGCPKREARSDTAQAASAQEYGFDLADVEPSNIKDDEVVVLLPTFATRRDGVWRMPVEAWVYEPEEDDVVRGAALEAVQEALEITEITDDEEIVQQLRPFVVDNESGKTVVVRYGDRAGVVGRSGGDGRCHGVLTLPDARVSDVARRPRRRGPPWVDLRVLLPEDDGRTFTGTVMLLEDTGISVVSDIDDTIKITEVHDKKKVIENTFARPYRDCPGVTDLYKAWANQGAAFHYVSNSPLPLFGALQAFIDDSGMPPGSIQLKPLRWSDGTFLDLFDAPADHKQAVIEEIIGAFETRKFVLVGDTGERDPEIYADIARENPGRVLAIYVRRTQPDSPQLQARLQRAFDGLGDTRWAAFDHGRQVPRQLPSP